MENRDDETVDEGYLDTVALEAASYLRRVGGGRLPGEVVEVLGRKGVPSRDATEAIDHGLRTGTLVMLKTNRLDSGIVRGFL